MASYMRMGGGGGGGLIPSKIQVPPASKYTQIYINLYCPPSIIRIPPPPPGTPLVLTHPHVWMAYSSRDESQKNRVGIIHMCKIPYTTQLD